MIQKKIIEGVKNILKCAGADKGWALNILEFLDSQDAMIRVEKECSHCKGEGFTDQVKNGNSTVCQICLGDRSIIEFQSLIE